MSATTISDTTTIAPDSRPMMRRVARALSRLFLAAIDLYGVGLLIYFLLRLLVGERLWFVSLINSLLVPALARIYGTLDQQLHHFRRYEKAEVEEKLKDAGFAIEDCRFLNRPGVWGWYVNARILRRRVLPRNQLRAFSLVLPLLKSEEKAPPAYGLSLLALARKP